MIRLTVQSLQTDGSSIKHELRDRHCKSDPIRWLYWAGKSMQVEHDGVGTAYIHLDRKDIQDDRTGISRYVVQVPLEDLMDFVLKAVSEPHYKRRHVVGLENRVSEEVVKILNESSLVGRIVQFPEPPYRKGKITRFITDTDFGHVQMMGSWIMPVGDGADFRTLTHDPGRVSFYVAGGSM